ncbi:MAG: CHAT domain-containing protein [Microcoleaceae cyanobacterium]
MNMEMQLETEYETYFQRNLADVTLKGDDIAQMLLQINRQTKTKSAVFWAIPEAEYLHLVLVLPGKQPIIKDIQGLTRDRIIQKVREFQVDITNPVRLFSDSYLSASQQLYNWIIEPFTDQIQNTEIDTLLFCLGKGLRSLPIAALHDGKQFLVEKYSLSLIPAFNLINTAYSPVRNAQVLAMGASEFERLQPLPAVPVELSTIIPSDSSNHFSSQQVSMPWSGKTFLNQSFTLDNLKAQLDLKSFKIIHLATHAEFKAGAPNNSYIQFWNTQLYLNQISDINWSNPSIELLVLSACRTAIGNEEAELGFAGLALNSGVKSALASFWSVSDLGTLALMSEFYQQLAMAPSKSEALRQTQINMIKGNIKVLGGRLQLSGEKTISLPSTLANLSLENPSHPFYWAAFTIISNPW